MAELKYAYGNMSVFDKKCNDCLKELNKPLVYTNHKCFRHLILQEHQYQPQTQQQQNKKNEVTIINPEKKYYCKLDCPNLCSFLSGSMNISDKHSEECPYSQIPNDALCDKCEAKIKCNLLQKYIL